MKAKVTWADGVKFIGAAGDHQVIMEGPEALGGTNQGMRPMELLLLGLGGCTSFDVVSILRKARQDVEDCVAELEAERSEGIPKVFTSIHIRFVVTGRGLSEKHVKRAVQLSAEKYCSASIMLERGGVAITHSFEIKELN